MGKLELPQSDSACNYASLSLSTISEGLLLELELAIIADSTALLFI